MEKGAITSGSEKQIAWAETLRKKALEEMGQEIKEATARLEKMQRKVNGKLEPFPEARAKEIIEKMERKKGDLALNREAKFWIDSRYNPTAQLNDLFWDEVQAGFQATK